MSTQNVTTQGTKTKDGIVNFDPNTGKKLVEGQSVVVNPGGNTYGSTQVPIVTSGLSVKNYADNTTDLNKANAGFVPTDTTKKTTDKVDTVTTPTTITTKKSVNTVTNYDGSTTSTNDDGSSLLTYSDGSSYTIPVGADVTTAKLGYDNLRDIKSQQAEALSIVETVRATEANDPQAIAAAEDIGRQYDSLIKAMEAKNNILGGLADVSIARYGGLGVMNEMERTRVLQNGMDRVTDLQAKKKAAIDKSNAAFKAGNVKAFNDSMKEFRNVQKEYSTALTKLNDDINAQIKTYNTEMKTMQTQIRQQTIDDYTFAKNNARDIALTLDSYGITDMNSKEAQSILASAAETYGISNPNVLYSAIELEKSKMIKEDLANAKSEAQLNKLLQPTPGPKATVAERESEAIDGFSNYFVPGATDPKGTPIIDDSGYVTPVAWKALIKEAPSKGLTRAKFIENFSDKVYVDDKGNVSKEYGLKPVEITKYIIKN